MMQVRRLVTLTYLTTILFAAQIGLSFLPNIELVSLLIIIYTLVYGRQVFWIIYTFVFLEGLVYGLGLWWINYLYVWSILAIFTLLFRKNTSLILWSIFSGAFGLAFGLLCAIPNVFLTGFAGGVAYWIMGIPFDVLHCAGNAAVCLVLMKPIKRVVEAGKRWIE